MHYTSLFLTAVLAFLIGFQQATTKPADRAAVVPAPTEAPPEPAAARPLAGTLREFDVPSAALGETRHAYVYLPPGYDPEHRPADAPAPAVVYFGDGLVVPEIAAVVEPLITTGKIRPVV